MHYQIIRSDKWYVVDISELGKPELFRNIFEAEEAAKDMIEESLDFKFEIYKPISGIEARKHKLKFKQWGKGQDCFIKTWQYDYPSERDTRQKRKTYRTIKRRELRKL